MVSTEPEAVHMSTDAAPSAPAPAPPLTSSAAMLALVAAASTSSSSTSSSWPQRAEAVRALKNDVIGNKGRKAAYVRLGAVQALVGTLLAALEEPKKRRSRGGEGEEEERAEGRRGEGR